jgi:hypothetical protein
MGLNCAAELDTMAALAIADRKPKASRVGLLAPVVEIGRELEEPDTIEQTCQVFRLRSFEVDMPRSREE